MAGLRISTFFNKKHKEEKVSGETEASRKNSSHPLKKLKPFFSCNSKRYLSDPNTVTIKERVLPLEVPVFSGVLVLQGLSDFDYNFNVEFDNDIGKGVVKYNYPADLFKSKSINKEESNEGVESQHPVPVTSLEIHGNRKKEYLALKEELGARKLLSEELQKEIYKVKEKCKILSGFYDILEKKKTASSEKKVEFYINDKKRLANVMYNIICKLNDVSILKNLDVKINVLTMIKSVIEDLDRQDNIIKKASGFEERHVLKAQNEIIDKILNFLKWNYELDGELACNLSELYKIEKRMEDIKNYLDLVK